MGEEKIMTICSCSDKLEITKIVSILKANSIGFCIQNDRTQDLFGLGRLGTGFNLAVGPVNVQILAKDYTQARQLIIAALYGEETADQGFEEVMAGCEVQDTDVHKEHFYLQSMSDWARSVILSLFWLFGIGSFLGIVLGIRGYKERPGFSLLGISLGITGLLTAFFYIELLFSAFFLIGLLGLVIFLIINSINKNNTRKISVFLLLLIGCFYILILIIFFGNPYSPGQSVIYTISNLLGYTI